jgi:hypothetical protein
MPPNEPGFREREERRIRPRERKEGTDRWIQDVFFAFGQTILLGWPMLLLVFQTPYVYEEVSLTAIVGFLAIVLALGTLRGGWVDVGKPWPLLSASVLGGRGGYLRAGRRAAYLSSALGLSAFGGGALYLSTGLWPVGVAFAVVAGVATIALLGHVDAPGLEAAAGRAVVYALGLGLTVLLAAPLSRELGSAVSPEEFAVVAVLGGFDVGYELVRRERPTVGTT